MARRERSKLCRSSSDKLSTRRWLKSSSVSWTRLILLFGRLSRVDPVAPLVSLIPHPEQQALGLQALHHPGGHRLVHKDQAGQLLLGDALVVIQSHKKGLFRRRQSKLCQGAA